MNRIIVKKLEEKIEVVVSRYQVALFRHPSDVGFRASQLILPRDYLYEAEIFVRQDLIGVIIWPSTLCRLLPSFLLPFLLFIFLLLLTLDVIHEERIFKHEFVRDVIELLGLLNLPLKLELEFESVGFKQDGTNEVSELRESGLKHVHDGAHDSDGGLHELDSLIQLDVDVCRHLFEEFREPPEEV
jgi:hypothetical protein